MKPPLLSILALILLLVVPSTTRQATAQTIVPLPDTWYPIINETDSARQVHLSQLIYSLTDNYNTLRRSLEVGRLHLITHTYGLSSCQHLGFTGRLLSHLLPFHSHPGSQTAFEACSDVKYLWPGDMQMNALLLDSNNRRKGHRILQELYPTLLPIYSMSRYEDMGSKKSFVLPFYDIGPRLYRYSFATADSTLISRMDQQGLLADTLRLCAIHFEPIRKHHTLLTGQMLIDSTSLQVKALQIQGRVDMATFSSNVYFSTEALANSDLLPYSSDIDIHYRYLSTRGTNSYHTTYRYSDFLPYDSLDRRHVPLDLSEYYLREPDLADSLASLRLAPIPHEVDSILQIPVSRRQPRQRNRHLVQLEDLGETLVDGTRLGPSDSRWRIYGPLDPASLGYDKFNGVTLRERARYNGYFANGQTLYLRSEIGYAFRLKELRWRLLSEYTYLPQRRGRITLEHIRKNSTFSSRFIQTINDALKQDRNSVNFDSLGIEYFQRYDLDLCHSIEIANGLMLDVGIDYTYRKPVTHGVRKVAAQRREELLDSHYSDFSPYLRLEYTPRQRYWYDRGYKRYINSPSPTFIFEFARAIPGALDAWSNFGRAELDIQQLIHLSRTRNFAYHVGVGKFFNRKGEYFINYRYFARSQYPETWEDDRIGGAFHLLDDYWYSSSPSYLQTHFMHETPFGLVHRIAPLSRYIIKERVYLGTLKAQGKTLYNELGYGIDNNYFNVGVFVGFKDAAYYGSGVKFRIELGSHL